MTRGARVSLWVGTIAGVATVLALIISLLAWLYPQPPADESPSGSDRAGGLTSAGPGSVDSRPPATPTAEPPAPTLTFLDTLPPQTGGANLGRLPRALAGQPGYDHPVVIQCPSNQSGDKVRVVTYPLRGRYLDFSATVRPYFTAQPDAVSQVFVLAGIRQVDDRVVTVQKGSQLNASMATPAPVTAQVDGAAELTLQVRCESPEGMIILVNAGLTAA